ncbi:MAG TPA: AmmeMemoRadiSam system protein B [Armatimonadetes bacterium]|nr:AmmeMemoRadiSam system protein B [Armatimonadota bacterium]
MNERPRLRPLRIQPAGGPDGDLVVFHDPLDLADTVQTNQAVAFLLTLLDGERTVDDVLAFWVENGHPAPPRQFIEDLVDDATERLLLDGPPFRAALAQALAEYRAQPARPMAHAPEAYLAEPAACGEYFDELFRRGRALCPTRDARPPRGLLVPHIDFGRGGPAYGAAYDALRATSATRFVIFGTAHQACLPGGGALGTFTRLAYDTPWGPVPVDEELLDAVVQGYRERFRQPDELFAEELLHRDEHSLEFQCVWLRYLFPERPITVLPILMGPLHDFYDQGAESVDGPDGLGPLLDALYAAIEGREDVCLIAGADWSHVGPRFGGVAPVEEADLEPIAARDETALLPWLRGDLDGFFGAIAADDNPQHVCSLAAMYALRALLPEAEAELLRYDQAHDPAQTVTFATALLR